MSSEAAKYKRNIESSILFMQQEHAATIKCLHEEIYCLQKKCTDLTFQLTMQGLTIDESGTTSNKLNAVQRDLDTSMARISALEKELVDRDRHVDRLESEARSQRKRWLDESRGQLQLMNSLRAELEAKANNIAYLTTEMHSLKQKGKNSQVETEEKIGWHGRTHIPSEVPTKIGELHPNSTHITKKPLSHHHYLPIPPKEKLLGSATRIRRPGNSKPVADSGLPGKPVIGVHPTSALMCRQLNPHYVSGSHSSGSESPDILPFLPQTTEKLTQVMAGRQTQVLPPIPVSSSASINAGNNPHPVLVHQVTSSTSQHQQNRSSPKAPEAAIVTLAVENAATVDAWSFAQGSRSSEYS